MTTVPRVSIVMGSDSDVPTMREAAAVLELFHVAHELVISSAHRAPDKTTAYAKGARARGVQVIIAAAGYAAHLAGVVAAQTTLPVIGVPLAVSALQGVDALLAMGQMPAGIPVATVTIGVAGAKNAAHLAVQILALSDPQLAAALTQYRTDLAAEVDKKDAALRNS
ncbi:MAG: 5-(carboxyamino)imidazole ribonucleotide mutase [Deltaproteobacteria bacterium]|nr:5-(carboxyamino)imidazole ribonucleotide mutase [Deltaproteobacteria bacterium]